MIEWELLLPVFLGTLLANVVIRMFDRLAARRADEQRRLWK